MNSHKNARLGFAGRVCLVERVITSGWRGDQTAAAFGASERTVWKWVRRFRSEGREGLRDRTSRPRHSPRRSAPAVERRIARLRAQRRSGPQIADQLRLPLSTVGDVLRRLGLGRLPSLVPPPPIVRYERATPGELLHIDAKKLGRIIVVGHRITGDRAVRGPRSRTGWSIFTSRLTTPRASRTPRSCPTKRPRVRCAFSATRLPGSRRSASGSSGS